MAMQARTLTLIASTVITMFTSSAAVAQSTTTLPASADTILILDASGSMWGQIGGVNKIVIAKDVVEELVRGLPADQRLGLVAYGHRTEGDCNDIQTLAEVGVARADLIAAIRGVSPKGKTPLTRSVEHAATELNFRENAATVILVSDGLENCDADPCALARTLEETGLDFTVHVVGFDVTAEERRGLQCIAEETGGEFLTANDAIELTEAISRVVVAQSAPTPSVESTPVPSTLALKATILASGPLINSQLAWKVTPVDGGDAVFETGNAGSVETMILPGDYVVDVVWTGWRDGAPKTGRMKFTVKPQQPRVITVPVDLGLAVVLEAPDQTAEGVAIPVRWSGPDSLNTTINVNRLDDDPLRKIYFFPAARARGSDDTAADTNGDGTIDENDMATAMLGAPTIAGDYEIRYVLNDPPVILARRPITVTDSHYELKAPDTAPVFSTLDITWSGPEEPGGVITLTDKASPAAMNNKNYKRAEPGKPVQLTAPPQAGEYEIRYVMAGGG
jgi:Ca-activated chloride channel family protein